MPVPFCLAWSLIRSMSGFPVFSSFFRRMRAVISSRKELSSASVPVGIDLVQLFRGHPQAPLQQIVGFGDELHEAVLDAVVDHFDVVAGGARPQVGDAGLAVDVGGGGLQHVTHPVVGLAAAAGHQAGAITGPGFAAGDAQAHEQQPFARQDPGRGGWCR